MEKPADPGGDDDSSNSEEDSDRSILDLETLLELAHPPVKPSARLPRKAARIPVFDTTLPSSGKPDDSSNSEEDSDRSDLDLEAARIPVFDTTLTSSSGKPVSFFDPFEKFDAPTLVEPELSLVQEEFSFAPCTSMMYHDDFKDYTANLRYLSIQPGLKANDPVVTDLRCLRYDPAGTISYKLEFGHDFQELPRRPRNIVPQNFPPLFREQLPVPKDKWNDLQSLKQFIPRECHEFFDNLPHQEESYRKTIAQHKKNGEKKRKLTTSGGENSITQRKKKAVKED